MKLADYSQAVTADELDTALRAGAFDGVFHYVAGTPGWALHIDDPAVVAEIRSRGWPQLGIDIPLLGAVNGAAAAARAIQVYGFGPGFRLALDIEPTLFNVAPGAWPAAADRWCTEVRAAGLSPGVYGTDKTVAACANRADWIWRAKPDECDPAGPGLADAFFTGRRVIQCGNGVFGGIAFDVSYSQFTLSGGDFMSSGPLSDPAVQQQALDQLSRLWSVIVVGHQQVHDWSTPGAPLIDEPDWTTDLHGKLAAIQAQIATLATPMVDVVALAAALATHPLTANLTDAERDAIAAHVLHHLAQDASAG